MVLKSRSFLVWFDTQHHRLTVTTQRSARRFIPHKLRAVTTLCRCQHTKLPSADFNPQSSLCHCSLRFGWILERLRDLAAKQFLSQKFLGDISALVNRKKNYASCWFTLNEPQTKNPYFTDVYYYIEKM